ncbi:ABC transporter substrate-binding protein [Cellulophaga baltica]|uniref:ABC transporter substrate-binding protein n=1 Tax=Cellulophaga TaxID=104264 RepID=UPI001C076A14|nr:MULTISPECIES: ABC transporter substrate-binding protein [Cellulophaga]MBU2997412.1 ABC transporter substrate-binding protein [Cellulophaga baltica]MDO6768809.1 ABC transporter substrate-binding protein [Cellulophaga sp. 1_MG-2023]
MRFFTTIIIFILLFSCKETKKEPIENSPFNSTTPKISGETIKYAKGFKIEKQTSGVTIITITSPWPNAEKSFKYALIPLEKAPYITLNKDEYDAIVTTPVNKIIATSTTHIPVLESFGVEESLIGFPSTEYISSKNTRKLITNGQVKEIGKNESINTEMVLELQPDLVIGFSINNQNKTYNTIQRANIPVVYNGDWTEETPLGKAEWIKFIAPFYGLEKKGDSIFNAIEKNYIDAKSIAKKATIKPTVLSGAMYKDVWYAPGGNSWASQFIKDANATYIYNDTNETGSLSLSWETVLEKGQHANFWISPDQFTTYSDMETSSPHYSQFDSFKNKNVYSFASTIGETGGLLFYELGPTKPDLILKDLIHIFHPELLPNYKPFFFKPLK